MKRLVVTYNINGLSARDIDRLSAVAVESCVVTGVTKTKRRANTKNVR